MTGKEKTRRFKGALLTAPFSPNHLQWYHKMDLIVDKAVRVRGNKVELSRRIIEEIRWNCKMALTKTISKHFLCFSEES